MSKIRLWIPPTLCECRLRINAKWTEDGDGASYRHPIPFTIQNIEIERLCPEHEKFSLSMPDTGPLFDSDKFTGQPKQSRGYLKYPIDNSTPAENLYTYFYFHRGQINSFPCGCAAYQHVCDKSIVHHKYHDEHTKKCFSHRDDTIDMQKAKEDFHKEVSEQPAGL